MARAIDADALYNLVERRYQVSSGIEHRCERDLLDLICNMPTLTPQNEPLSILVLDEPDREYIDYICPKCKNTISQRRRGQLMRDVYQCKYHDNCGQRVDWHNPQLYHIPSADKMKDCPPEVQS